MYFKIDYLNTYVYIISTFISAIALEKLLQKTVLHHVLSKSPKIY